MEINGKEVKVTECEGKQRYAYFACTCRQSDNDFWEEELLKYLEGGPSISVVSGMIMHLEHYFQTSVTGIGADMWFGISLENYNQKFYIQCDRVEHGLLAVIKILEDVYIQEVWEEDD